MSTGYTITERADGRFFARVNIGRDKNGRIKYKNVYGYTKKEVKEKVRAFTTDLDTYGRPLDNNSITLSDWTYKHLFTNIKSNVSASTFERYVSLFNTHIKNSDIATINLKDLQQIHLQHFLNDKSYLSKSSLKKIYQLLNNSFKAAISNNIIRINPISEVKLPSSEVAEKDIEILTIEEQKAYIQALKNELYGILYLTTLYTGMRMGEVIALKWHNIDFTNNTITVAESYKRVKKYNADGTSFNDIDKKAPKTERGKRTIVVPAFLTKELRTYKLSSPNSVDDLVFCTETGNCLSDGNIRKYHHRICSNANIRKVSFHALRHTFATRMIESGVDVKTVSETLGHSTIELTLNTYVHSTNDTKKAAAATMEKMYNSLLS